MAAINRLAEKFPRVPVSPFNVLIMTIALFASTFLAGRGFDVSDEAYYLAELSLDPSITTEVNFGDFLAPSVILSGVSLQGIRLIGFWLLFLVAILAASGLAKTLGNGLDHGRGEFSVAGGLLISSGYYGFGIWTPSYNYLAFLGVLLMFIGALQIARTGPSTGLRNLPIGVAVVAIGFAISTTGKFSAGIPMILAIFAFFLVTPKRRRNTILLGVSSLGGFAVLGSLTEGGLIGWFDQVALTATKAIALDSSYQPITNILIFIYTLVPPILIAMVLASTSFVIVWTWARARPASALGIESVLPYALVMIGSVVLGQISTASPASWRLLSTSLALLGVYFLVGIMRHRNKVSFWSWRQGVFPLALAAAFSPTVGSNNGATMAGLYAGLVIVAVAAALSNQPVRQISSALVKSLMVMIALMLVFSGSLSPYRQESLFIQTSASTAHLDNVLVSSELARDLWHLSDCVIAEKISDEILLDFTGEFSTGIVLGAGMRVTPNIYGTLWGNSGSAWVMKRQIEQAPMSASSSRFVLTEKQTEDAYLRIAKGLISTGTGHSQSLVCGSQRYSIWRVW